ncbi:hypothetical protein Tco_0180356 [Tanacetum coccineum]
MEDEHLDTIPETESDELIKSSVEDLVQIPSESEDSFEGECDLPPYDDSSKNHDLTFSNPLFDANDDDASSDEEEFKISSNPLFNLDEVSPIDDEVLESITSIPPGIDSFDVEFDLIESLLNRDTSFDFLFKGDDFLLDDRSRRNSLSLLYDNSSPRPPEEFYYENPTESFSPSPIPVVDSDSLMEEIDIFLDGDDSIPPGIENDDFDSEDDDNSTSRPEFESFHFDYPDSGNSTIDVVEDIPVDVPNILPTHPALQLDFDFISSMILAHPILIFLSTLSPVINTLLQFSSENEDKVFNHGVLASKEKSSSSLSLRGLKCFKSVYQRSPYVDSWRQHSKFGSVRHSPLLSPLSSKYGDWVQISRKDKTRQNSPPPPKDEIGARDWK